MYRIKGDSALNRRSVVACIQETIVLTSLEAENDNP